MKNSIYVFLIFAGAIFMTSCKKTFTDITYSGNGTPPVLTSNTDTLSLTPADSSKTAIALTWTNPNYQFSNGISSLNVKYLVRVDTAGANFSESDNVLESDSSNLSTSFTIATLNSFLGNTLKLATGVPHNIEIEVESYLGSGSLPLYSNVLAYTVTPYSPPAKVTPPTSGQLFIVGSAVNASVGWDNPIDADNVTSQQFTQISNTDYQITIPLIGDGEYKFIAVDGSWSDQWSIKTEQNSGDPSTLSYDLYYNGGNVRAPITSATYLIDVDFQLGKVTLTKQ